MIWVAIGSGAIVASAGQPPRGTNLALPRYHLLVSAALGGAAYAVTRSARAAVAPLVSGFLIDADHLLDYALIRTAVGERKILLALHGWEWLPAWLLADRWLGMRGALALGYATHLLIDQLSNEKRTPLAYFISYRAAHGFRDDQLGAVEANKRHLWRKASPLGLLRWL